MKTSAMAAQIIFDRLHAAIGIDPSGLDPARLRWIIGVRCRHLNLPDSSAYAAFLQETPSELDSLIEEAVVQETRFFATRSSSITSV